MNTHQTVVREAEELAARARTEDIERHEFFDLLVACALAVRSGTVTALHQLAQQEGHHWVRSIFEMEGESLGFPRRGPMLELATALQDQEPTWEEKMHIRDWLRRVDEWQCAAWTIKALCHPTQTNLVDELTKDLRKTLTWIKSSPKLRLFLAKNSRGFVNETSEFRGKHPLQNLHLWLEQTLLDDEFPF